MSGGSLAGGIQNVGGSDVAILSGGQIGFLSLSGAGGDIVSLSGASISSGIFAGDDADIVTLSAGTVGSALVAGAVVSGSGDDTLTLSGAAVFGTINAAGAGNNQVNLLDGSLDATQMGGTGVAFIGGDDSDALGLNGADVFGDVATNDGDDNITVVSGLLVGDVLAGDGADAVLVEGGTVDGDILGMVGADTIEIGGGTVVDVFGGEGDDAITLLGGEIVGDVSGGVGDDTGFVTGAFDFDNLGAGIGFFAGDDNGPMDDGNDTLVFTTWAGAVNADRLPEWNTVNIVDGSRATFTGGTLQTDSDMMGDDIEVSVDAGATLLLSNNGPGGGDLIIDGNVTNDGLVDLSGADSGADNVLTVNDSFASDGDVTLDTVLDDGKGVSDTTDLLVVGGDTSGATDVTVLNADGPGGLTGRGATDGILIVEVGGASDGDFVLANDVVAGIFEYDLNQADGQNWYLQSDFLPQIPIYESLPSALQTIGLSLTGQLVERVGVRSGAPSPLTDAAGNPVVGGQPVDTALWLRGVGASLESEGDLDSTTGASFDQDLGFVQGGGEVVVSESASGRLLIGALGHWGNSSLDVDTGGLRRGSMDIDFYGGGLTATWYGTNGLYVDGVVQYTAYDIDISTASRWTGQSTDGYGVAVSGEAGYRIQLSERFAIVPQAQLTWQTVDFDDFTDPDGVAVNLDDGDSLVGRLGVALESSGTIGNSLVTGYGEVNLLHEFLGDNTVNTTTELGGRIPLNQNLGGTSAEFGLGGTVALTDSVSLYAEVDYTLPFDNGVEGFQGLAGIRVNLNPPPAPPPPAPVVAPVADSAFIVFFDWDRADLTPQANVVLDDVVMSANRSGYASVRLDGYTDLSGSAAYNLGLSERRANSVANGLIARGIAPDEIVIRAFGEENPLVPTPDGVREPQNRRVEIFLT
ncbi:MAG: autotransporter outer membrane beta-barrel domain-containing protein [Pseudomonadota bacterium]